MLQKRFQSLHSILQDRKQVGIGLPRFGADFQEKRLPHWLFIVLASDFLAARESCSGMVYVSPITPYGRWKAVLSSYLTIFWQVQAGDVNLILQCYQKTRSSYLLVAEDYFFLWMCKKIQKCGQP